MGILDEIKDTATNVFDDLWPDFSKRGQLKLAMKNTHLAFPFTFPKYKLVAANRFVNQYSHLTPDEMIALRRRADTFGFGMCKVAPLIQAAAYAPNTMAELAEVWK